MKPEKGSVRRSFSKAARTYDGYSEFQHSAAIALAALSRRYAGTAAANARHRILDAGCGTGHLTHALAAAHPGSNIFCADFALPMLIASRAKLNGCGDARHIACDLDHLPFDDAAFDVVASNLAYQWPPDLTRSLAQARRVLKPGGLFLITTLAEDTLMELRRCCVEAGMDALSFMTFESPKTVQSSLEAAGFEVLEFSGRPVYKRYDDIFALIRTLKNIGANPKSGATTPQNGILKRAGHIYKERFSWGNGAGIKATYDLIFAVGRKLKK